MSCKLQLNNSCKKRSTRTDSAKVSARHASSTLCHQDCMFWAGVVHVPHQKLGSFNQGLGWCVLKTVSRQDSRLLELARLVVVVCLTWNIVSPQIKLMALK